MKKIKNISPPQRHCFRKNWINRYAKVVFPQRINTKKYFETQKDSSLNWSLFSITIVFCNPSHCRLVILWYPMTYRLFRWKRKYDWMKSSWVYCSSVFFWGYICLVDEILLQSLKLREELFIVNEDRLAGRKQCSSDELKEYFSNIIVGVRSMIEKYKVVVSVTKCQ